MTKKLGTLDHQKSGFADFPTDISGQIVCTKSYFIHFIRFFNERCVVGLDSYTSIHEIRMIPQYNNVLYHMGVGGGEGGGGGGESHLYSREDEGSDSLFIQSE